MNGAYPKLPFPPQRPQRNLFVVTADGEIRAGVSEAQVTDDRFVQKRREPWIDPPNFIFARD
jgi:hypothetical protein